MTTRIVCECQLCNCNAEFVTVDTEDLINLIQHGRLTKEQTDSLKARVGSRSCRQCFAGNHRR